MAAPVLSVSEKFIPGTSFSTMALADGSLLAVYARNLADGGYEIVKQFINADGTAKTTAQRIFSKTEGEHLNPVATRLSDGRFVVAWESDDSGLGNSVLKYQIFKADGSAATAILTIGTPTFGNGFRNPQITAFADGTFSISYEQGVTLKNAFFSATGVMSQETTLNQSVWLGGDAAALKDGNHVTVAASIVDAGGMDVFAYIRKPTGEVTSKLLFHTSDLNSPPEVTVLANGNFLVVWGEATSTGGAGPLKAHLYAADGTSIGDNITLATNGDNQDVKALANGTFAVAYTQASAAGGNAQDLMVATYSASGEVLTGPAVVKSQITDSIIDPSIEVMKDGRYVVSYERGHYQIFDPRTSAVSWKGTSSNEQYGGTYFSDQLDGFSGSDKLYGFGGNDILNGGAGNDILAGGLGRDTFIFSKAPSSVSNFDKISDFDSAADTIKLENSVFKSLKKTGKLKSSAFWSGSKAHDDNDRIVYNKTKGLVYYDKDGKGGAAGVKIFEVAPKTKLYYHDFVVI